MATFDGVLSRFKWWFYENGGMHVYDELKTFANKLEASRVDFLTTLNGLSYGNIIVSAPGTLDVSSAVAETVNRPQGIGYADKAPAGLRGSDPPTNSV